MARPSEQEIEEALRVLDGFIEGSSRSESAWAARRAWTDLREASRPRLVLLSKEAADLLGVDPSNLNAQSVAGLPEPAFVFPRPTKRHPDRVVRLGCWWKDEIENCARRKRARLGQTREGGAK